MNILFTVSYYRPYISGITVHAERLAQALSDRKHKVTIATSQLKQSLPIIEKENNVKIIRIPVLLRLHKGFFMPLYVPRVWKQIEMTDVVVAHLPQAESLFVSIIAKILKKRFYVIYHCEVQLPKGILNKLVEYLLHLLHFITLVNADKVITYTRDYADNAFLLPHFYKKTLTIYPPIPNQRLIKKTGNKILDNKERYVIGVAARLAAEKGFEYLFSAIPHLIKKIGENFIIQIAGPMHPAGEEKYWKSIQPLLGEYNKYISFSGTLPSDKMGDFYRQLDVLVLPSVNKTEAFGMVQVEAMAYGVPVVASNLPGVREPIRVTRMGELTVPGDPLDIAKKISLVLHNKRKYSKNPSVINKVFAFNKSINLYEKIFTSVS